MATDQALEKALEARMWGQRPSTLLGIQDPVVASALDEALAVRLIQFTSTLGPPGAAVGPPPAGMRYETSADWGRPLQDAQRQLSSREAFLQLRERERVH